MRMLCRLLAAPLTICALAPAAALTGCGGAPTTSGAPPAPGAVARSGQARLTAPQVPSEDLAALAAGNDAFAVDLYQTLRTTSGNMAFAPESLSIALAMTFGGAGGTTAAQMASTMHFALPADRLHPAFDALDLALNTAPTSPAAFRLTVANAVWADQQLSVLPSFLDLLARNYGAGVRLADFIGAPESARQVINQWLSDQTAGKVPELLTMADITPQTRMVLTNAIYFKADWQTPFAPQSAPGTFHAAAGDVSVPMMTGPAAVPVWTGAGYTAARLPYAGGTTSMLLIVPDVGAFDAFEAALTADTLQAVLDAAATATLQGVSLPRFMAGQHFSVKTALMALGMVDAFDGGAADFSGIDGGRDLFIKDVIHQANVAVDEQGTEAAAATAVVINRKAVMQILRVDRPFLFLIRDDANGATLFMGRVLDPTQ